MAAERSLAKSWQSSTVQVRCCRMARPRAIHAVGDVTTQSSPARQLVPPRADVTSMRAVRTNAIRSRLSALLRVRLSVLLASLAGLCAIAGLMASNVLAADEP